MSQGQDVVTTEYPINAEVYQIIDHGSTSASAVISDQNYVYLLYVQSPPHESSGSEVIYLRISTDHGATFGSPIRLKELDSKLKVLEFVGEAEGDDLLFNTKLRDHGEQQDYLIISFYNATQGHIQCVEIPVEGYRVHNVILSHLGNNSDGKKRQADVILVDKSNQILLRRHRW